MNTPTPRTDAAWASSFEPCEYRAAHTARTMRDKCAELERELVTERAHRMELATLAKRMVAAIRKLNRNDSLSYLVIDYLVRNKLDGETMRTAMKEGAK